MVPLATHAAARRDACRRRQTRFLYSCVRVSISILSPFSTNIGTVNSKPVPTSLAGFKIGRAHV